ncbi:MAG: hypothetical protein GY913_11760 [Proteobacteria bacterium]|nr:hypothetical protein [Pseudomonadota bacterium]MCP4917590.1 hypothetical protein [Pseudomonadota bacterium]
MRRLVAVIALAAVALTGCSNACQDTCKELAAYAEECGYTVNDEQVKTCTSDFSRGNTESEDRDHCAENVDNVRTEWTCEEAGRYMGVTSGGGAE